MINRFSQCMENSQLNSTVFKFYPKQIHYYNEAEKYIRTEEYLRLSQLTNSLHATQQTWQGKINDMNFKLGTNFSSVMPSWLDRCLVFQMQLNPKGKNTRNVINLDLSCFNQFFSLFCLIQQSDNQYSRVITPSDSRVNDILELVNSYINQEWNLVEFPRQLLNNIIPSVSFECEFNQFTYYNAFFTNTPIIS